MKHDFDEKARALLEKISDGEMPVATLSYALRTERREGENSSSVSTFFKFLIAMLTVCLFLSTIILGQQERENERESRAQATTRIVKAVEGHCVP